MERLLKCFASFFLDMIFCKYSATKLQPPLGTTLWRRYCNERNLFNSLMRHKMSYRPVSPCEWIFEMSRKTVFRSEWIPCIIKR